MAEQWPELADGTLVTAIVGNGGLTPSVLSTVEEWLALKASVRRVGELRGCFAPCAEGWRKASRPLIRVLVINDNHSSTAPGSDGVRPPFPTVAVTGVSSANSGHCSAIPDAVATL